ncbi:disease resistance protein RUN1-like [Eucalyptus grandis]|uniref:disease resistance protein RUN1-like n=1 Tax=Eucalyptus grandis TaxID=71139 RepID=UPI00192EB9F3|nr:disease resistance protein RUN1-like [Eucalyptus grandis]
MGELESLEQLLLDSTSIEEIPEWRKAKKLKILSLVECKSLRQFNFIGCAASSMGVDLFFTQQPKSIENFNSLTELDLTSSAIQELPDLIGNMKNLRVLKMFKSNIRKLPSAIGMLEKLEDGTATSIKFDRSMFCFAFNKDVATLEPIKLEIIESVFFKYNHPITRYQLSFSAEGTHSPL